MLRLDLTTESRWVDLACGVRVEVRPVTSAVMLAARMDPEVRAAAEGGEKAEIGALVTKAVARQVVVAWDGVGDAEGNPIEVTPEGIDALLDVWPVFEAFQGVVMAPVVLRDAEKKGSAPLPTGSSAGARDTAPPAGRPVPTARSRKTPRKPSKAGRSGT